MEKKPVGIVVNMLFLLLAAVVTLVNTVVSETQPDWLSTMIPCAAIFTGVMGLVLSLALFALAYYLWQGENIAWWVTIIVLALGALINLLNLTTTAVYLLLIQIFLILLMLHKDTINYCSPDISWTGWSF